MFKLPVLTAVCALALAGSALAASDREFLTKAMQGDNSEMRLGAMAERRAASPEVKDFGRMLNSDHAMAGKQAMALARRLRVPTTMAMAPEAREEAKKLRGLQGRDFDAEFVRYMVEDHRKDISDFERQAKDGHGPTRGLAEQTLPTLRKHLEMAEKLQGQGRG